MNPQNDPARIRAKKKLKHYFSLVFKTAGLKWDGDNNQEVDDLVDDLIRAAINQIEDEINAGGQNA